MAEVSSVAVAVMEEVSAVEVSEVEISVVAVLVSAICSWAGISVVNPADGQVVEPVNLLSIYGLQYLWSNVITNFSTFAPLGMVLVAVIGSSVAEKSGFLIALSSPWWWCSSALT